MITVSFYMKTVKGWNASLHCRASINYVEIYFTSLILLLYIINHQSISLRCINTVWKGIIRRRLMWPTCSLYITCCYQFMFVCFYLVPQRLFPIAILPIHVIRSSRMCLKLVRYGFMLFLNLEHNVNRIQNQTLLRWMIPPMVVHPEKIDFRRFV